MIEKLKDEVFLEVSHCITNICEMIRKEAGVKPKLDELCEILMWGIRATNADILDDYDTHNLERLIPKVKNKKAIKPKTGDIIAIPNEDNKFFLALYLYDNPFGTAYGIFNGLFTLKPSFDNINFLPWGKPFYSGKEFVINGKWQIIGNRVDLLKLFPADAEIYHYKKDNIDNDHIGMYGSAESPNGVIRKITEEEAKDVGLLDNSYEACRLEENLQELLCKIYKRK